MNFKKMPSKIFGQISVEIKKTVTVIKSFVHLLKTTTKMFFYKCMVKVDNEI